MNRPYTLYVRAKEGYTEFTFLLDISVAGNPPEMYHGRYCIRWMHEDEFAGEVAYMFRFMELSLLKIAGLRSASL